MRRLAGAVAAAAAVLVAGASLAACGSPATGPNTITLYNGQHLQTTEQLISAFEKKTGITVVVRSDDEDVLADQIATEGSTSPADVFFTENSPAAGEPAGQGPARAGRLRRRWPTTPSRFNSPQGDWVGVSARVSVLVYNPALISGEPSCRPRSCQLADPQVQRQAGARARRDRLPADRHVDDLRAYGQASDPAAGSRRSRRTLGSTLYPRQRDRSRTR